VREGDLSAIFSALADPTRRAILARLSEGEAPVKDLAEPFELSGPAITKHLKVLERAGLISRLREGQRRPCRLEAGALEPAAAFLEGYREMWEERFDRLDAHLKSMAAQHADARDAKPAANAASKTKKTTRTRAKTRTSKGQRDGQET
jgi:DNA-binding transcriptional ArsR family regulator